MHFCFLKSSKCLKKYAIRCHKSNRMEQLEVHKRNLKCIVNFLALIDVDKKYFIYCNETLMIEIMLFYIFEGHLHQRRERAGHRAEAEAGDC